MSVWQQTVAYYTSFIAFRSTFLQLFWVDLIKWVSNSNVRRSVRPSVQGISPIASSSHAFFVQLCSSWQAFNWVRASHGSSAIPEPLILSFYMECSSSSDFSDDSRTGVAVQLLLRCFLHFPIHQIPVQLGPSFSSPAFYRPAVEHI